jgi:hypothetical protein
MRDTILIDRLTLGCIPGRQQPPIWAMGALPIYPKGIRRKLPVKGTLLQDF